MRAYLKQILFWLCFAYGFFIFYCSFIPFNLEMPPQSLKVIILDFFDVTYDSLFEHISRMDLISNFLLYIPLGFLVTTFVYYVSRISFLSFLTALLVTIFVSITAEILQVYTPDRTSSFPDVIVNFIGGFTGAVIGLILFNFFYFTLKRSWKSLIQEKPFLVVTYAIGICLLIGGLFPFDFSIQISDLKATLRNIQWIPFTSVGDKSFYYAGLVKDLLLYTLFAGFYHFSLRLYSTHPSSYLSKTVRASVLLAGSIELLQLIVDSRLCDVTDVIIALVGGFIGATISLVIEKALLSGYHPEEEIPKEEPKKTKSFKALKWFVCLLSFAATGYLLMAPLNFDFTWDLAMHRLHDEQLIPFYSYWVKTDFFALQDLLYTLLIFIPLGAILVFCLRNTLLPRFIAFSLCLIYSMLLEGLQIFQPERVADITDVLSASTGSLIGILIVYHFIRPKESADQA